jgi:tetratricopeptide (TPR) repeat protein
LEKNFPRSEYLNKTASVRAALLQEAGAYSKAYAPLILAIQSNQYAKKPEELASALLNAGLIAEGLNKLQDSKTLLLKYMAEFPGKNPEGSVLANRTLLRVSGKGDRQIASAPQGFQLILNEAERFESSPIAKKGDVATRIKEGGTRLETLVKKLMEVSGQISTYPDIAAEASCLIPSLFSHYQKAVDEIANDLPENSRAQVQNLSMTLQGKSKELGIQCLKNSSIAEHDGPRFREVNQKWGWEWDPIISNKATQFIQLLEDKWQSLDPVAEVKTEEELYQQHLQGHGSADSWYQLAKLRFAQNQLSLCRLTLVDALSKYPYSGKLMNAYAVLEAVENPESKRGVTFLKAAKFGSSQALVNLSLYHLKGGRLSKGLEALKEAYEAGLLDKDKELKEASKEWVKK